MAVANGKSAVEKAVAECANKIEFAGSLAKQGSSSEPFQEFASESIDETVHEFLKSLRHTPCHELLINLKSLNAGTNHKIYAGFQLLGEATGQEPDAGIVPMLGVVSTSDLRREGERREAAELALAKRGSPDLRSRMVVQGGRILKNFAKAEQLARQIVQPIAATPMIAPMASGLASGALLPFVAGALPAVLVAQAVLQKLGKPLVKPALGLLSRLPRPPGLI